MVEVIDDFKLITVNNFSPNKLQWTAFINCDKVKKLGSIFLNVYRIAFKLNILEDFSSEISDLCLTRYSQDPTSEVEITILVQKYTNKNIIRKPCS